MLQVQAKYVKCITVTCFYLAAKSVEEDDVRALDSKRFVSVVLLEKQTSEQFWLRGLCLSYNLHNNIIMTYIIMHNEIIRVMPMRGYR